MRLVHFHMLPPVQNFKRKENAIRCTTEVQALCFVQAFSKKKKKKQFTNIKATITTVQLFGF